MNRLNFWMTIFGGLVILLILIRVISRFFGEPLISIEEIFLALLMFIVLALIARLREKNPKKSG